MLVRINFWISKIRPIRLGCLKFCGIISIFMKNKMV